MKEEGGHIGATGAHEVRCEALDGGDLELIDVSAGIVLRFPGCLEALGKFALCQ